MTWVVSFKHSALTGSHDKDEITFLLPLPLHLFNIIILLFLVEFVIHIFMYNIMTTKYFLLLLQDKVLFCYSIFFSGVVTFHPPLPLKFLVPPFLPFSLPFFFPSFLLSNVVFFFSFSFLIHSGALPSSVFCFSVHFQLWPAIFRSAAQLSSWNFCLLPFFFSYPILLENTF